MIRAGVIASAVVVAGCPMAAFAQSEVTTTTTVSALTGYASNPFSGEGGGSGYAEIRLQPAVVLRTEQDTVDLRGDAQVRQYFQNYSTRDNYGVRLGVTRRQNARLTLNGSLSYYNAFSGSDFVGAVIPVDTTGPVLPIDPSTPIIGNDLGLFGSGNRRETVTGQLGLTMLWSAVDQINLYGSVVRTDNTRPGLATNYRAYNGGLGYSRRLSDRLSIGLTGSANKTDYFSAGSTTVYTVQGTVDARLADTWSLNGGLGVSRLDSSTAALIGGISSRTTLSGNISLCRIMPTDRLCLGAQRAILPSSFGGSRVQSSVDVSYSARLSERDSLTASSAYTDVGGVGSGVFSAFRYWSNAVGYQRRLGERLSFNANGLYRTLGGGAVRRGDDVGGSVGVGYTFGTVR